MHESSLDQSRNVVALRPITNAPTDESVASMLDVLQDHLKLVREGQLRSLALVSVSADGSAIGTQWSCAHGDIATLIGKLTVLAHDMMAARR
jgi:hypothetical protein